MPLTSNDPLDGCCRSAITRNIVVLPHPDGPIKDTNSPSATCRLTSESASTRPSAVSKVSEIFWASTTSRFEAASGKDSDTDLTGERGDTKSSRRCLIVGSWTIDMLGLGDAMPGVWQKPP